MKTVIWWSEDDEPRGVGSNTGQTDCILSTEFKSKQVLVECVRIVRFTNRVSEMVR